MECCFEHECQFSVSSAPPKHTPQQWIPAVSRWPAKSSEAVVGDGVGARAVRGDRHFEEGREGLRARSGNWEEADGGVGDDVGFDDESDPRVAGASTRREGYVRGDGGDRRVLEAVLLLARRRLGRDVGQRPRREECAGPQERCFRCCVVGRSRGARVGAGVVRAAATDPGVAGSDPGADCHHARAQP